MTLRLNGTGKNIGSVTYNTTTGDIKAAKGSTSQTVALIVQGNDGTDDWYYSKKIDATETVNASAIKSALGLSSDIDLSVCKIWLEITDIETPAANTTLDTEASCATTGVSSTTPQITWTPNDSTAGYNTSYTASIKLTADTGYEFIDSMTATVLGNSSTSVNKNADGTLTVTYDFTGKTVIPFCTSASSGIGQSGECLAKEAGTGDWLDGERFSSGTSASEIESWVNGLGFFGQEP